MCIYMCIYICVFMRALYRSRPLPLLFPCPNPSIHTNTHNTQEVSIAHASAFGFGTGAAGTGMLLALTNPTVAALGVGNIALYAGAYTYSKRITEMNTWLGSIVGAIPPLMGWIAADGAYFCACVHVCNVCICVFRVQCCIYYSYNSNQHHMFSFLPPPIGVTCPTTLLFVNALCTHMFRPHDRSRALRVRGASVFMAVSPFLCIVLHAS